MGTPANPSAATPPNPAYIPQPDPNYNSRPGLRLAKTADNLGPLADLAGTWVGTGFNLISLPDFSSTPPSTGPLPFRLKLNATLETLQFIPIGGAVPNRGVIATPPAAGGQPDISLFGLTYMQKVSDQVTNSAMHIEPGIWVYVPGAGVLPAGQPDTVVRMGSIPHGDSILAQSSEILTVAGGPVINAVSSTPVQVDGSPFLPGYLDPFLNPALPPGIKPAYVANPNQLLLDDIAGQTIVNTVVLIISTNNVANVLSTPSGGILNIPFVTKNASATQLDAIFWIETVQQADGSTFLQLQYTQTVILNFLGINWPHISVATLTKQ
jgi:hypothetical protein